MGMRASAYLVYGIPLEMDIDEDRFEDGLEEFVYMQREEDSAYPVDIVATSTRDYPQYIVILPGSNNSTDWDEPLMINELPEPPQVAIDMLKNWIKVHGLEECVEGEEGWYLAAMWS